MLVRVDHVARVHRKRESQRHVTGRKTLRSQLINSSSPRHEKSAWKPLSLDKFWPPQAHSGMSRRHEQKHLLHNWSDCRYRDRPQTPRAVLSVGIANRSQRLIPTGEQSGLRTRRWFKSPPGGPLASQASGTARKRK